MRTERNAYLNSRYAQAQRMIDEGGNIFSGSYRKWPKVEKSYEPYPFMMLSPLPLGCFSRENLMTTVSLSDLSRHLDDVIAESSDKSNPQGLVGLASERVIQEYLVRSGSEMVDFSPISKDTALDDFVFSSNEGQIVVNRKVGSKRDGAPYYHTHTDHDVFGVMRDRDGAIPVVFEVKTGRAKSAHGHLTDFLQPEQLGEKIAPILDLFAARRAICVVFAMPDMITEYSPLQRHFRDSGGIILSLPFVSSGHAVELAKRRIAHAQVTTVA